VETMKIQIPAADGKSKPRTIEVIDCTGVLVGEQVRLNLARCVPWPDDGGGHADLIAFQTVLNPGPYQVRHCGRCGLRFDAKISLGCPKCQPRS